MIVIDEDVLPQDLRRYFEPLPNTMYIEMNSSYIHHLMLVMKELKRVMKKTGTLFWNMGDSYASSGGTSRHFGYSDPKWAKARNGSFEEPTAFDQGIEPKSLMMIPERLAMAMIDDGWILRNKIVWYKRNGMPSSVKDRLSNKWEYVFFFTKSKKYYFDMDSIRKPLKESNIQRKKYPLNTINWETMHKDSGIRVKLSNTPKKYNGVYSNLTPEESEKYGSPRARNMRERPYDNNNPHIMRNSPDKYAALNPERPMDLSHPNGANPGDVLEHETVEFFRQKGQGGNFDYGGINSENGSHYNQYGVNPGYVITSEKKPYAIAERDKNYVEYRNLPPLKELSDFLNEYRTKRGYTINQIEDKMNSQAPHHWFNAESYPSAGDWVRIKEILEFPDTYDRAMTEMFTKPSEKQNDPNGANPGDVNQDATLYGLFTDAGIQYAFIEYLERERPELLMPSVLDIPTKPHSFAHFAVMPETLIEPLIKVGCSSEACVKCGKPKLPFFIDTGRYYDHGTGEYTEYHTRETKEKIMDATGASPSSVFNTEVIKEKVTKWLPSCKCNADFEPGTVLDPFAGSGTVGVVAKKQGKSAILIEISPEYVQIIKDRLEIAGSGTNINANIEVASIRKLEEFELEVKN